MSFPSSERNKVDIDTYLILKKEHDVDDPVLEEARYDILAIENEAPDFIKNERISIGSCEDDPGDTSGASNGSAGDTFGPNLGAGFPIEGRSSIRLHNDRFDGNIVFEGGAAGATRKNIFIRFQSTTTFTQWYEITNAFFDTTNTTHEWLLDLKDPLGEDVDILTTDPNDAWNNKRTPLKAEFRQDRINNKPEFDGRFFAKIHSNGVIKDKIIKAQASSTNYSQKFVKRVQYINQKDPKGQGYPGKIAHDGPWYGWGVKSETRSYGGGSTNPDIGSGGIASINFYGYKDVNDWFWDDSYNAFGTLPTTGGGLDYWHEYRSQTGSNWFIDRNPAYTQYIWAGDPCDNGGFSTTPSSCSWLYGGEPTFVKDGSGVYYHHIDDSTGLNSTPSSAVMQYNYPSGVTQSKGIYDGGTSIHLSFGGLDYDSGWKMSLYDWATTYANEIGFIEALTTAGCLWRWAEDPDEIIYKTSTTTGWKASFFNTTSRFDGHSGSNPIGPLITFRPRYGFNKRERYTIRANALLNGNPMGSGPSKYLPTNDPDNDSHFAVDGSLLNNDAGCSPCKPTTRAPGIRQDGMGIGTYPENANNVTYPNGVVTHNQKRSSGTGATDNQNLPEETIPGSVTWQILEPSELTTLKYSSHSPAIFETEPKENLDLEIYHEVGQTYPLEYNYKTNELYTPVGSVVTCWRSDNAPWVLANPLWNGPLTSSPAVGGYTGTPIDPIPVGNINIGGASWTPPMIVSAVGDNTITLTDDTGVWFDNDTDWPSEHILPGDHLSFIRPDGSRTSLIAIGATVAGGNIYEVEKDISDRVITLPWFNSYSFGNGVESNRIRDDYNQVTIDKGPKVSSILDEPYKEERKLNGLIYSGIYKSTSGVNNLNQFIQAEKITKDLNPTFGSIQKLFQRRINLITFCEDKVVKILSNKDALYNADGNANLTATDRVLGDAQPYIGEFGISKNPESFASESYRTYFTDKQRGMVLRLSKDGLTPISDHGMIDWFRDNLPLSDRLIGGFDIEKREYNLTLPDILKTLSFREDVKGWVSFKSFITENSISLTGKYYTFNKGNIWRHHVTNDPSNTPVNFNTFYNNYTPSHVTTIFNTDPKSIKNFQTLNYEGSQSRVDQLIEYINPNDNVLYTDPDYHNLEDPTLLNDFGRGWYVESVRTDMQDGTLKEFIEKEGKWFNYIKGKEIPVSSTGLIGDAPNFAYDPNEFSWQGIGLSSPPSGQAIGGCLDPNAINYGCATLLHPNSLTPCPNDLPLIDFDDGTCNLTGIVYGCLLDPNASNYGGPGNTNGIFPIVTHDDGSCISTLGCVDPTMFNYSSSATADCNGDPLVGGFSIQASGWNASPCCQPFVYGCMALHMFNTTSTANAPCSGPAPTTPGSGCFPPNCWGPKVSPGLGCCEPEVWGCTDPSMFNYDPNANTMLPGSCIPFMYGCMDSTPGQWADISGNAGGAPCPTPPCFAGYYATNYNPNANTDDGSCTGPAGCMDPNANNYSVIAYVDDGSCTYGCCNASLSISNHNLVMSLGPGNTCPSGGADYEVTITQADCQVYVDNGGTGWFNQTGTLQPISPATLTISPNAIIAAVANTTGCPSGATNAGLWEIDVNFSFPGITPAIPTCNIAATQAVVIGCTDDSPGFNNDVSGNAGGVPCPSPPCIGGYAAFNYNPNADVDDGSCAYPVYGCTDGGPGVGLGNPLVHPGYGAAYNFDPLATIDDGSCDYIGCMTSSANNYQPWYTIACGSCCSYGTTGCINSAIGCHPAVTAIQSGISISGLGTCSPGSIAPNAVWNTTTLDCGTCRDGTTCGSNFCCGDDNGFDHTNFDPDATVACTTPGCCTSTNISGCGQTNMPSPNSGVATFNYNPCVDTNDNSVCIPTVYGCMDPTALNYGSYASGSPWGYYSANTNFGVAAPLGYINTNGFNYTLNPTQAANPTVSSYAGHVGPNTPDPNACIYPVYGCTNSSASNYNPNANVNQISFTNTNTPCCNSSGCILPNYFTVTPGASQQPPSNISSQPCQALVLAVAQSQPLPPGVSLLDCYGDMIDVSGLTINGTASGTTVGNGWQAGNNNIQVALNGGETCADHNCDANNVGISAHLLQNQDGYFDPGNIVPNTAFGVMSLTAAWGPWPSSVSNPVSSGTSQFNPGLVTEDCCTYIDGCMDHCALNFNPAATLQSAQVCSFGTVPFSPSNQPPWQSVHPCSTAVSSQ